MVRRQRRVVMPMSFGGLIRFPEEEDMKFKIKPKQVLWLSIVLVILEFLFRMLV